MLTYRAQDHSKLLITNRHFYYCYLVICYRVVILVRRTVSGNKPKCPYHMSQQHNMEVSSLTM